MFIEILFKMLFSKGVYSFTLSTVPFPSCGWQNLPNHAASIHLQLVDCEAFRPHNFTCLSSLSESVSPRSPDGRRREHSRTDNLTFSSPTFGEAYPSDTESLEPFPSARATILNATYPIGQAILAFSPPPARLNHPICEHWSPVGCHKSLPAGQPHLFLLRQRS